MSDSRKNDSKNNVWNEWAHKRSDWDISNNKRPKLDIHKSHLSQSCVHSKSSVSGGIAPGREGNFRRTNSMPTKSNVSPMKEKQNEFLGDIDEENDALAEAAAAIELKIAQTGHSSKSCEVPNNAPSTSSKTSVNKADYKNNGSSGFDVLFSEELAEEDVEECMLLASQEIQASQKAGNTETHVGNTSFSQAYSIFSKGVDVHSSVLESGDTFKKPNRITAASKNVARSNLPTSSMVRPPLQANNRCAGLTMLPPSKGADPTYQSRNSFGNFHNKVPSGNPQAEAEVRRLTEEQEKVLSENKTLKESLRTKDGEAAILRSQLRQALVDREHQKVVHTRSATASEQHYREKLKDLEKELDSMKLKLQFQEAETNTARERYKLLTNNTQQRLKLVEPQSPGPSVSTAQVPSTQKTPTRQRHVSGFLNRSTFEEPQMPRRPPAKRLRTHDGWVDQHSLEEPHIPEPLIPVPKLETRSVGEQTTFDVQEAVDVIGAQRLVPLSLGQKLSDRLKGIQLGSAEVSDTELWNKNSASLDETETIPTLSLLSLGPKSKKRRKPLEESFRPSLINCAKSLKHLMSWNDPTADCPPTRASILQIAEECTGILHYNLLILQDIGRLSDRQLRNLDQELVSKGAEIVPLDKNFDLLDEMRWYKEEYSVEMRRCLGIFSEIALVSSFAASLVTGAIESNHTTIKKHKFMELPDYSHLNQPAPDEEDDRFYVLRLLCDICKIIVEQRFTIAFNGVLAGVMNLLKNCAQHSVVDGRSQSYFLRVIRQTLIARPSNTVLLLLIDLLSSVSSCEGIMKGLCTKCDDDDFILDNTSRLCTFSKGACALQLVCIQMRAITGSNRWRLVDALTKWLVGVISQGSAAPSWIVSSSDQNNTSHIPCCNRLACTLVLLLWDAFEMLEKLVKEEDLPVCVAKESGYDTDVVLRPTLVRIMRRAIILLQNNIANNMCHYMARVEGLYELLLQGIVRLQKHLGLSPSLESFLEDLVRAERATDSSEDESTKDASCIDLYSKSAREMLRLS